MKTIVCTCGNRLAVPERDIRIITCNKCKLEFVNIFSGRRGEALKGEKEIVVRRLNEN